MFKLVLRVCWRVLFYKKLNKHPRLRENNLLQKVIVKEKINLFGIESLYETMNYNTVLQFSYTVSSESNN